MKEFSKGEPVVIYGGPITQAVVFGTVRDNEEYFANGQMHFDTTVVLEDGRVVNSLGYGNIVSVKYYALFLDEVIKDLQSRLLKCEMILGHSVTEEEKQECQPRDTV